MHSEIKIEFFFIVLYVLFVPDEGTDKYPILKFRNLEFYISEKKDKNKRNFSIIS